MISKEELQQLATLARMKVSDQEAEALMVDISNILAYVGQVSAVSVSEGEKTPLPLRNVMREDTPRTEHDPLAEAHGAVIEALPKREGDYNVVRKIIQKDA